MKRRCTGAFFSIFIKAASARVFCNPFSSNKVSLTASNRLQTAHFFFVRTLFKLFTMSIKGVFLLRCDLYISDFFLLCSLCLSRPTGF